MEYPYFQMRSSVPDQKTRLKCRLISRPSIHSPNHPSIRTTAQGGQVSGPCLEHVVHPDILPLDGHYPTNSNDTRLSKETLSRMSSSGARYLVNVKLKCLDIWKSLVLTSSERSFHLSHSPYPYQPYDSGNKTPKALMYLPQKRVQRSSFIEWLNISVGNGTQLKCIILFYYSVITILIAWLVVSKSFNVFFVAITYRSKQ